MNLSIRDTNELYDINLLPLTQLCGRNIPKKTFIIESLEKYFSSAKYMEYESEKLDNIRINGELLGRKYFHTIRIQSRSALISELQLNKHSVAKKHLEYILNDYSYQVEMEKIQIALNVIFGRINQKFLNADSNLELRYQESDLLDIVQSSSIGASGGRILEELTNFELLDNYVKLISATQQERGSKTMVLFENIDHMISVKEYTAFMKELSEIVKQSDLWCMVSTSIEGYAFFDKEYFEGIHCINDIIYGLPEYEELKQYIEFHYPVYKAFTGSEFEIMLMSAIHNIGIDSNQYDLRGHILEQLVNTSACLRIGKKSEITQPEIRFLQT